MGNRETAPPRKPPPPPRVPFFKASRGGEKQEDGRETDGGRPFFRVEADSRTTTLHTVPLQRILLLPTMEIINALERKTDAARVLLVSKD